MTIANIITFARLGLVPMIVWAMIADNMLLAFVLFLIAGVSDAVDGFIARNFNQQSELGTILDPLADKMMLVSVFIVLGYLGHIPLWLTILVVSRDVLIVFGIVVCFMLNRPVTIAPIWISKANTTVQIVLACFELGLLAFALSLPVAAAVLVWITGALTVGSAAAYTVQGVQHLAGAAAPMSADEFDSRASRREPGE
ncbi:CDP-alcohol phosphatidyltransferase family protein [Pseudahrensia aquimaris]|uniref:CDP-diacylglycerol--glycerol-3-phosphate 3-phosphatidyltransferase n=1 Tax=Pseudahrensia aquimaris TaxID=744461 RepID=A0ABW3FB20_9HYPH